MDKFGYEKLNEADGETQPLYTEMQEPRRYRSYDEEGRDSKPFHRIHCAFVNFKLDLFILQLEESLLLYLWGLLSARLGSLLYCLECTLRSIRVSAFKSSATLGISGFCHASAWTS